MWTRAGYAQFAVRFEPLIIDYDGHGLYMAHYRFQHNDCRAWVTSPAIGRLFVAQSNRPNLFTRFGGFAVSLVFSTVVSLVGIPFVLVNLGAEAWAELAVALATAAIFGVVVAFGWGTVGAAMTAGTLPKDRPALFFNSLVSRAYLFLFSVVPMALAVLLLSSVDPIAAVVAAIAYLLPYVGASWYFVGESKPWRLFAFDVLPQGLGTITGVVATFFVPEVWVYVTCQLIFNLLAVVGSAAAILRSRPLGSENPSMAMVPAMRRLSSQWHGVVAAGTGTINSNVPIVAVTLLAAPLLPVYVLADKLFRYAVAGFGPVLQVIQGWIPEAGPTQRDSRVQKVASLAPILGLAGGAALMWITPWAAGMLSAGRLSVGWDLSVPFGLIFCGVVVAQILGLACLIPIGKGAELAKSTAIGALLNVVLMIVLGLALGAVGIAWAVAAGELLVAGYQIVVVRKYFAGTKASEQPGRVGTRP